AHQHPGEPGADQAGGPGIVAAGWVQRVDSRATAIECVLEYHRPISFTVATSRSTCCIVTLGLRFSGFRWLMPTMARMALITAPQAAAARWASTGEKHRWGQHYASVIRKNNSTGT